jgi:hypothetical protein
MGALIGIQILGTQPDFDQSWPTVMWNENIGAVSQYSWGPTDYTLYKNASQAMFVAGSLPWPTRLVFSSTDSMDASNVLARANRTNSLGFQLRAPGSSGTIGIYYNYSAGFPTEEIYSQTKGFAAITTNNAAIARDVPLSGLYDLFVQNY